MTLLDVLYTFTVKSHVHGVSRRCTVSAVVERSESNVYAQLIAIASLARTNIGLGARSLSAYKTE